MLQEEWSGTAVHQYPERTVTMPLQSTHLCMGNGMYHPINTPCYNLFIILEVKQYFISW